MTDEKASAPQPFVKWAGGKRQLLDKIRRRMPDVYGDYFEPFIGGGAVLFSLRPHSAHINDVNSQLVNVYRSLRDDVVAVMSHLDELDAGFGSDPKVHYMSARSRYNELAAEGDGGAELAALFIFLNKHCFNGLYRVNRKGEFNVPYNNTTRPSYDEGNLEAVSELLSEVEISCGDFEAALAGAGEGDFVFLDPPYAPLNPTSFEAYTKEGFPLEDHQRLARVYRDLDVKGAKLVMTNHDTPLIRELYEGYRIDVVDVRRSINRDASKRTGQEVFVTNFDWDEDSDGE